MQQRSNFYNFFSAALYTKIVPFWQTRKLFKQSAWWLLPLLSKTLFYEILNFLPGCIFLVLIIIDSLPIIEFVTSRNKTQSRLQFFPYQLATDCYIKLSSHWSIFEHTNAIRPELLNGCFITRYQVYIKETYIRAHIHIWYTTLCGNYISIPSQNARG